MFFSLNLLIVLVSIILVLVLVRIPEIPITARTVNAVFIKKNE